ncbi:MAG: DegT/DnrJ/EryC1/StrS aminotransferase family protein, partial [Candidatus Nitrosopelagicus sp.]|nr:DegT/DnrJ/EryC1/StrS aminotransferase family protein [Candidatus Nitrosopelagicus sp.]
MKIPFFIQEFTEEMEEAAIHALRNESFVGGESVSKFEEEFAQYIGTKYAVSVSSG